MISTERKNEHTKRVIRNRRSNDIPKQCAKEKTDNNTNNDPQQITERNNN